MIAAAPAGGGLHVVKISLCFSSANSKVREGLEHVWCGVCLNQVNDLQNESPLGSAVKRVLTALFA